MAKTTHVTTVTNGVPHTSTVKSSSSKAAATAGGTVTVDNGVPHGSGGWTDPVRAPGDQRSDASSVDSMGNPIDPTSAGVAQDTPQASVSPATPSLTPDGQITDPVTGKAFSNESGTYQEVGGAPVQTAAASPTPTQNKYAQALSNAQSSGLPAPQDAGAARSVTPSYMPSAEPDTSVVDQYLSADPAISTLMQGITQLLNPKNQVTTLMQDYTKLRKSSGLDKINQEIIDADTVINGTEDDIRNEIQTAGGFGTESQVQAMTLARNKGLLTRYNQLVQMKTDATNQLNTMMSLNQQDKQLAQSRVDSQIGAMFNMANFRQTALNNTQSQYRWLAEQQGADGLYNSLKSDPRQLAFAEKILGAGEGGLQKLAVQASADRARKTQMENLDIAAKQASINASNRAQTEVVDVGGRKILINSQTGKQIAEVGGGTVDTASQLAHAEQSINDVTGLLGVRGLANAVGTNSLSRFNPVNTLTGARQGFVAGVEQLRQGLTLTALQNAKANGATFGALSEGELNLLSQSSSKLGTWAIKDSGGNVTGYNVDQKTFKKELDTINNFSKLDYIKKGGTPASVGVVAQPDGSYWTQNSDGSYTKIY